MCKNTANAIWIASCLAAQLALTAGCSTTPKTMANESSAGASASSAPGVQLRTDRGWEHFELGPADAQGLHKIMKRVSGFEIRFTVGTQGTAPVDVEVYDDQGRFVTWIEQLPRIPSDFKWSGDGSSVIIDGQVYRAGVQIPRQEAGGARFFIPRTPQNSSKIK